MSSQCQYSYDFPQGCRLLASRVFFKVAINLGRTPYEHCQLHDECPHQVQQECRNRSLGWLEKQHVA